MAGRLIIALEKNETYTNTLTLLDNNNVAINLTGASSVMDFLFTPDALSSILTLSSPSAGLSLGGVAGTVLITVTPTQIALFPRGQYFYRVVTTLASGGKDKVEGTAFVND